MYTLTVKYHFDAAHALRSYEGECRNLHGHTWDVEVTVGGETLDDRDILYDFKDLKTDLTEVLAEFDHRYLNEVPPFDRLSPTAENLARIIFEKVTVRVEEATGGRVQVLEVAVWESPVARVVFSRA
ncbi:6-carboxytetrahydropterin synthase QueD [Coriobacteriia bacterium Es71-Z0120]|uniref:6-carboxytetrahydropterin synthase QueD n=1 Tax=Parvivirga hydrogeniphila TaxID=2939460 RepID=UPI0022608280|nr:6-carboxytetrahydropterin synthase QueD [Parvivirga hydrogeniphila]MCL4079072.1 6-carboxytetrahydropterin synthase QueD [Parvivirga hydrogeniphila]